MILRLIFFMLAFPNMAVCAEDQLAAAIHVHSSFSSGEKSIPEIAALAREKKIDVLVMTDLLYERYEYGIRPLRFLIRKSVERDSISKSGAGKYFQEIKKANQQVPEVLTLDGVVATPYYYWSGGLWPGPLVLNNRAKDILVLGLGLPGTYDQLRLTGKGNSGFSPYEKDQGMAPYQKFINEVEGLGGLAFWSHPQAEEHVVFSRLPFGLSAYSDTRPYVQDLKNTENYTGFGIYAVELKLMDHPEEGPAFAAGGLWDHLLLQFCRGRRKSPAWVIGEVDFNGYQGENNTLDAILNMVRVSKKSPPDVWDALKRGRNDVISPGPGGRRLLLKRFSAEALPAGAENFKITVQAFFSGGGEGNPLPESVHWTLIKNGAIFQEWDQTPPFERQIPDPEIPSNRKTFYRLMAYASTGERLLSNPVFVSPVSGGNRADEN